MKCPDGEDSDEPCGGDLVVLHDGMAVDEVGPGDVLRCTGPCGNMYVVEASE
ncbi:MAG TPA: hypothetical protein VNZ52_16940 [Candidatus Thermoplasmatota archaeon]|nr:hypothetical protein [Candidatus Thermoplasmatota archaeon]